MNKRFDTKRVALCGLLLSMMLVLGWVEHMIPLNASIPGIKLGLSNGVLIFAVYMLNVPTAYLLMGLKVLLSGMLFGSPSAMIDMLNTAIIGGWQGVRVPDKIAQGNTPAEERRYQCV